MGGRIGIFGGSFDPPHLGHLIIAEHIAEKARLDKVIWVPARVPPHKEKDSLSKAEDRLKMVMLAISGNPLFEVSRIELSPDQPPWTINMLLFFKNKYPEDELHLIIGGDSLNDFTTWKDYRKLLKMVEIDVALRPGYDKKRAYKKVLMESNIIDCPQIDISATKIRESVKKGNSIRYLVSENVRNFIIENKLYR